ncbi:MAG: ribosomal RNA small subunit methyltransferase A [Gemmatimonadaceae bacterium]|nr:ribosomal RNA small subunit methyltransferase A [Gemmatimonadaceae bacterium]
MRDDLPRARKRLGQHFLTDPRILARIADALELTGTETVVEIGPGRGALTEHLLDRAKRVVAVELDRDLVPYLREKFAGRALEVVEGDVLARPLAALAGGEEFALAGNVPYYITTPILFHALAPPRASRAVYLVQREVAERVVAPAGAEEYGALSVNVQALATPRLMFRVPAGAFSPPPKVESAVLRVDPRAHPAIDGSKEREFRELVQAAFGLRRKQMRRVVRTIGGTSAERADELLRAAAIDPEARPETLTVEQFAALSRAMKDVRVRG